jgi:hypothetical protein
VVCLVVVEHCREQARVSTNQLKLRIILLAEQSQIHQMCSVLMLCILHEQ